LRAVKTVYLSLGSNLGDRLGALQAAMARLAAPDFRIRRVSSIYETEPVDLRDQPWFLNLVLEAETDLFPKQLLARIRKVELELGHKRLRKKGPRTIDIDILLYGETVIESAELVIPHPRLTERRFVLEPLAELAPQLRHPVSRQTIAEMLPATLGQAVRAFRAKTPRTAKDAKQAQ
jgi:2-amino-4-hydroxy-6-hydroxymethyldihydropteridine diphosphokinase